MSENFLKKIRDNAEAIKIGFAIFAAIWILIEYYQNVKSTKVERTFSYTQQHTEGNVWEAKLKLGKVWLEPVLLQKVMDFRNKKISVNEIQKISKNLIRERNLEGYIFILQTYYMDISACVSSSLCDKKTACDLFYFEVLNFRDFYMDFLYEWEDGWKIGIFKTLNDFIWSCEPTVDEPKECLLLSE